MKSGRAVNNFFRYLAEPRTILAEPLGSAEPWLKNTALDCLGHGKPKEESASLFYKRQIRNNRSTELKSNCKQLNCQRLVFDMSTSF